MQVKEGLKEIKKTFIYSMGAFLLIAFIAGIGLKNWELLIQEFVRDFIQGREELFTVDGDLLAWGLFKNNVKASLFSFGLGIVPLVFLPVLSILINGAVIGAVFIIVRGQFTLLTYTLSLLPHGIFEIPAFLLAASSGIYLCRALTSKVFGRGGEDLKGLVKRQVQVFIFVVVPLLALAALIEAYISPLFMMMLLG